MQWYRAWPATILLGAALFMSAACSSSKPASCTPGTERCTCYGNSTCNPGLECLSTFCVSPSGAGGGAGNAGQGGSTGGAGGAEAGGAGSGGAAAGGAGTGGAGGHGGAGGAVGSGTSSDAAADVADGAMCGDTSSDPNNCGACGHACKNADPVFSPYCPPNGCCAAGHCGPTFSPCLTQGQVTSCTDYCSSLGETCVQDGCALDGLTWAGWGSSNACSIFYNPPDPISRGTCSQAIVFDASTVAVRCCCTDTP